MKKILGLDLGTNSIGWALIEQDFENKQGSILGMGSRIIPMTQDIKDEFGKGNSVSQTADRTKYRSTRRLRERYLLRRERLHRVLNVLGFLPEHYANEIDFEKHLGQFLDETEPKIAWKKASTSSVQENGQKENRKDKFEFLFQSSFKEMAKEFNGLKIPYDWTIYYLRKKALTQKIEKEELAWLILNFNQKRGYYQLRGEEEEENSNKLVEFHSLKVVDVKPEIKYNLVLENGETYYRTSEISLLDWKDTYQDFIVTKYLDNAGKEKQSFILKEDIGFFKSKKTKLSKKKANETVEEQSIRIVEVKEEKQDKIWYYVVLENGWIYRRESFIDLSDWKDKVREFIVTTDLNDDGSIKTDSEGKESRSFRAPKEDDWTLIKKKTENDLGKYIAEYEKNNGGIKGTVGTYIYDALLKNPAQKINGKLVRTIERKFYKDELKQVLEKQIELQPELFTDDLFNDCVRELYRSNEAHQLSLSKRDFVHLFLDDIIFYQRPLRSQKSSIGNCTLEYRTYKRKNESGKEIEVKEYLKAIPKSNPYYQEFRIWQWLYNLKVYQKEDDKEVTSEFLNSTEDYEKLFDFLNNRKEIEQKPLIKQLVEQRELKNQTGLKGKALTTEVEKYRWNYVEDKKYPCNETKTMISTRLEKVENIADNFLTREIEQQLWHIIYSVNDKNEFEKALKSFANKHNLDETSFIDNFRKFPPFKSDYGTFSEKAIKKLLPLMRLGKYWDENAMLKNIDIYFENIEKLLGTLASKDENISEKDRQKWNKAINIKFKEELENFQNAEIASFQGLRLHIAQYLVYGRHSEVSDSSQWKSIADLEKYLEDFKQHSLRNPIVEQVVTETLRVVKDIWKYYGKGAENFFDEIHVELGREMKNTAEDRKKLTNLVTENENTNLRIKAMLAEFINDNNIENVRPHSPIQMEALKIYEDGVLNSGVEIPDDIAKISKSAQPTKAEFQRYKLWLDQKYKSPYTGLIIPLSKLFTEQYQIEHIIPQSRYFDDSFSNKVICESAVNLLKDKQLGFEFINNHQGEIVETGFGNTVIILNETAYQELIKEDYKNNRAKRNKLLMGEIPEKMIERQLNDTRYISKLISSVFSNIVRADKDDDGINSKNVIPCSGKITSTLKQDWGLNDVWNELILPRFKRMNELTKTEVFTSENKEGHTIPAIPLELSKGFQKKRIDHRHHAMDALVIACATRDHVNLLNNQSAKSDNSRYDLQNKLRKKEKWQDKNGSERDKFTDFKKPWDNFTINAKNELENIVVSFKQNLRVINKATNHYERIENGKKVKVEQKGVNWAIRKPMHKETVSGKVNLSKIKVPQGKILTATRKTIDISFNLKTIEAITDTGIQKILKNYLAFKDNNPELAFTPEGLEEMNKNISQFNSGKYHQPIYRVRIYELGSKFQLGQKGNRKSKYVEAAKGTNLFFAVYQDKDGKRNYATIPLNEVIERQKQGLTSVPETSEKGDNLLFHLSPNDLVYVPTAEEQENSSKIDFTNLTKAQKKRIFVVNDFSTTCYFTPNPVAANIAPKEIDLNFDAEKNKLSGSFDIKTASFEGKQIKDVCIKLKDDRLGNISKANQ